ncbi:aldehyde dehydrogenase family protein, partial [Bacillus subtilis]
AQADIQKAVDGLIASKYRNGGQTCVCANRIYVHESIKAPFVEAFAAEMKQLKVGNGMEPDSHIGPLINEAAVAKVQKHIEDAQAKGGEVIFGQEADATKGYFQTPALIANATDDMLCMKEETFGPLAPIATYTST